ncbi:MAG: hypothetical protein K0S30_1990 [Clostridia bacterium]|jgi:hypothetical protein|nr:hypothetical protein [Clostridia bacterium]
MMEIRGTASTYMSQYETLDKTTEEKDIQEESQSSEKDQFVKSDETGNAVTYNKVKKLTPDQIKALREQQDAAKVDMLKRMMQISLRNQANNYGLSEESQNLIKEIFGSLEEGIPPLATTPEEAKKAIEPGGAYSVEAVAGRIMKMAKALGGDDPEKVQVLREAVEKGFERAGMDFKEMTSGQKLPQICLDTYDEIMKQFDAWQKEGTEA